MEAIYRPAPEPIRKPWLRRRGLDVLRDDRDRHRRRLVVWNRVEAARALEERPGSGKELDEPAAVPTSEDVAVRVEHHAGQGRAGERQRRMDIDQVTLYRAEPGGITRVGDEMDIVEH